MNTLQPSDKIIFDLCSSLMVKKKAARTHTRTAFAFGMCKICTRQFTLERASFLCTKEGVDKARPLAVEVLMREVPKLPA